MPTQDGCIVVESPEVPLVPWCTDHALGHALGLLRTGDRTAAGHAFSQITRKDPLCGEAHFFLGLIHQEQSDLEMAVNHYEEALRLTPDLAEASNNLGVVQQKQGNVRIAEMQFREAIRLMPDYAEAHNNLGNALQDQGRFDEAVPAYRQALRYRTGYLDAYKHLGNALRALGQLDDAIDCYDQGLTLAPEHGLLHTSRAMVHIQKGDLLRGFAELEWRLKHHPLPTDGCPQPMWDGALLEGRTLLVCAEQGLGDNLQFIRFVSLARRRGGKIVVACPRSLARIVASSPDVDNVVTPGCPLPEFACHAPVMSLPRILGTTLATIPSKAPYLYPDPNDVSLWRKELGPIREFKVGIVWQGNPVHTRDHERSFRLEGLAPVARIPGVRLFSLQKNFGLEQLDEISDRFDVTPLGDRLQDLMDTAAVMCNLDLIVSVDSAPAHLAGALGVPAWIVLPYVCDWRWMSDREDTPWYPSMRLVRQPRFGDWDGLFQRMAQELSGLVSSAAGR